MFWSCQISPELMLRARKRPLHVCTRSHLRGNSRSLSAYKHSGGFPLSHCPELSLYLSLNQRLLNLLYLLPSTPHLTHFKLEPVFEICADEERAGLRGRKADTTTNGGLNHVSGNRDKKA